MNAAGKGGSVYDPTLIAREKTRKAQAHAREVVTVKIVRGGSLFLKTRKKRLAHSKR